MKIKAKPSLGKLKDIAKKKPPKLAAKPQDQEHDISYAINLYLRECGAKRFFFGYETRYLYDRPFFMVLGPEKSGKTTLFSSTGHSFPFQYPDADDGYTEGESTQPPIVWYFDNNAVWLDMPGRMIEDKNRNVFNSITRQLAKIRFRRPIDGLVIVISCEQLIQNDMEEAKSMANSMRNTINELIKTWGIEIPIHFLFSHADAITGFDTFFADEAGKWDKRVLGTSVTDSAMKQYPRIAFLEEFDKLINNIQHIRLQMITRETDSKARLDICRFPIVMESLREKLATFVATMFRRTPFVGKPLFGGFYFTCIKEFSKSPEAQEQLGAALNDPFDHPLNPHRKSRVKKTEKSKIRAWFCRPLISGVLSQDTLPVSATKDRHRREIASLWYRVGGAALIAVLSIVLFWSITLSIHKEEKQIRRLIDSKPTFSLEGIKKLDSLYKHYATSLEHQTKGQPLSVIVSGHNSKRSFTAIEEHFSHTVQKTLLNPCFDLLERTLLVQVQNRRTEYMRLKENLRTYLAISSLNTTYPSLFKNETLLVNNITALIKQSLGPQVPWEHATLEMSNNIILAQVRILKTGKGINLPAASDRLIVQVQSMLVKLLDIPVIYKVLIEQGGEKAGNLELNDIVPGLRENNNISLSMPLNEIFTPAGWRKYIVPLIASSAVRVQDIDKWVVGPFKKELLEKPLEKENIKTELIKLYLEDTREQWYRTMSSFTIKPFESFEGAENVLRQLSSGNSPSGLLLQQFASWPKALSYPDSTVMVQDEFDAFKDNYAFLENMAVGDFAEYIKHLESIAEACNAVLTKESAARIFRGDKEDPLATAFEFVEKKIIPSLNNTQESHLKSLLLAPLQNMSALLTTAIPKEVNKIWRDQVYQSWNAELKGKYPFTRSSTEADFETVITFFNPDIGPLWKMFNSCFSTRGVEEQKNWKMTTKSGQVPISFTHDATQCLTHARIISKVFFKGSERRAWQINIKPVNNYIAQADFVVNNTSTNMMAAQGFTIKWPTDASFKGHIAFTNRQGNPGMYQFKGSWALMRMLTIGAKFSGRTQYTPVFQLILNVPSHAQALAFHADVKVSTATHPFCNNIFSNFRVPETLIKITQ